jgi:hypothetical protein
MANAYHFPDHVIAALALILEQDKTRERFKKLVSIAVTPLQDVEDVLWEIHEGRNIDSAEGVQLDQLGAIVGEFRQGRSDDVYRLWIRARGYANRAAGRPDDFLFILRLLLEPDATIEWVQLPTRDAEAYVTVTNTDIDLTQVLEILQLVKPAGVALFFEGSAYPPEDTFAFAGPTAGAGFDVGHFSGIVGP